ncbi:Os07g0236200, partial [Oryza sativa Japonica Group]
DLVKGKDTLMPLVDFQEKKCTGWRQLKILPSGVVKYLRNTCYEHLATLESDIFASLIQHILVGDC